MHADEIEPFGQRPIRPDLGDAGLMGLAQPARGVVGRDRYIEMEGHAGAGEMNPLGHRLEVVHRLPAFDLDQPGKDSFFHRAAGATEVIISSAKRWAILHELREQPEWDMAALVGKMSPVDLVLVEGFKRDAFPKLEIHRIANGKPLIHPEDPHVVAVASDTALPQAKVPVVDLNDTEAIADLLLKQAVPISAVRMA